MDVDVESVEWPSVWLIVEHSREVWQFLGLCKFFHKNFAQSSYCHFRTLVLSIAIKALELVSRDEKEPTPKLLLYTKIPVWSSLWDRSYGLGSSSFKYRLKCSCLIDHLERSIHTQRKGVYVSFSYSNKIILHKMGQFRPLFCLFSSFSHYSFKNTKWKSIDVVIGIRTKGRRMLGADKTTELVRPPKNYMNFLLRQL